MGKGSQIPCQNYQCQRHCFWWPDNCHLRWRSPSPRLRQLLQEYRAIFSQVLKTCQVQVNYEWHNKSGLVTLPRESLASWSLLPTNVHIGILLGQAMLIIQVTPQPFIRNGEEQLFHSFTCIYAVRCTCRYWEGLIFKIPSPVNKLLLTSVHEDQLIFLSMWLLICGCIYIIIKMVIIIHQ